MKKILVLCLSFFISSCSSIPNTPDSEHVRLIFNKEFDHAASKVSGCRYLGIVVGSEGHWYDYLFLSNEYMTYAALDDLRKAGHALGANFIYVDGDIDFNTSVTFYGQAYHCEFDNQRKQ